MKRPEIIHIRVLRMDDGSSRLIMDADGELISSERSARAYASAQDAITSARHAVAKWMKEEQNGHERSHA